METTPLQTASLQTASVRQEIGFIKALYRYPIKSMAGESITSSEIGWHGLAGDRRLAFRRIGETNGFPWLTASKLRELILFKPVFHGEQTTSTIQALPSHVITPEGTVMELYSEELRADISQRLKSDVELLHLKHGIFDESPVSIISTATIDAIEQHSAHTMDVRRFRPNILIETTDNTPFAEDAWVGKTIMLGETGVMLNVIMKDERCMMVNLDPDTAQAQATIMKSIVQLNNNDAGVYCSVLKTGRVEVGQKLYLMKPSIEMIELGTSGRSSTSAVMQEQYDLPQRI
jgi:uncharacterized protein YcbX